MGMSSLQSQLLKAGLADKKQANRAKQEKRAKRKKNNGKQDAPPGTNETREAKLAQEKKSRELDLARNREKMEKERLAQVRQLIEENRLDLSKGDDAYYFKVGTKIKKLYVDKDMAQKLSCGQLAIVSLAGQYEVIPAKTARQVVARDPESLILHYTSENENP